METHETAGTERAASVRLRNGDAADSTDLAWLLGRAGAGDQEAFARFYDKTCRRVLALAQQMIADPEIGRQCVQDTYLEVWVSSGGYDQSSGEPVSWLMAIAHRRIVERARTEQSPDARAAHLTESLQPGGSESSDETPANWLADEPQRAGALSDLQRKSLNLTYWGGLTCQETARWLGVTVPTVRSCVSEGLHLIRGR